MMKKHLPILGCLMAVLALYICPQQLKPNSNAECAVAGQQILSNTSPETTQADEPKKVLMHYMGWFGPDSIGRHWNDKQPHTPLINYYNSKSWATQMYHILLSWSCGIDGLVINVKDDYDDQSLRLLVPTIKRIREIDSTNFRYQFSISYDDQGMENKNTAIKKFKFLRDTILHNTQNFLDYNGIPAIFIWNYNNALYLSPADYEEAINEVFPFNRPTVLWNEIDYSAKNIANSFYPWVQGFSADGSVWGGNYLYRFDTTLVYHSTSFPNLNFTTMGVWAGFDDRKCTWGQHRWIDRQKGAIYDSTWNYVKVYNSLSSNPLIPLKWVYIETWNDWNEGSEIEPSKEFGSQYLLATINNINTFKDTTITTDTSKFEAVRKIYEAADLIERKIRDSTTYYPYLQNAIKYFILNQCDSAICKAKCIIVDKLKDCCRTDIIEYKNGGFEIYPNPAKDKLFIRQKKTELYTLQITDIQGKAMFTAEGDKLLEVIDISLIPKGMYLISIKQNNRLFDKKIIIP
jgi:hypothetical protein